MTSPWSPADPVPLWFMRLPVDPESWEIAAGYEHEGGKLYRGRTLLGRSYRYVLTNGGTWRVMVDVPLTQTYDDEKLNVEVQFALLVETHRQKRSKKDG